MVRDWTSTRISERVPLYVDLAVSPPVPFRHGNRTAGAVARHAVLQWANGTPRRVCRAGDVRSNHRWEVWWGLDEPSRPDTFKKRE